MKTLGLRAKYSSVACALLEKKCIFFLRLTSVTEVSLLASLALLSF